jgi:hypothetical protein
MGDFMSLITLPSVKESGTLCKRVWVTGRTGLDALKTHLLLFRKSNYDFGL